MALRVGRLLAAAAAAAAAVRRVGRGRAGLHEEHAARAADAPRELAKAEPLATAAAVAAAGPRVSLLLAFGDGARPVCRRRVETAPGLVGRGGPAREDAALAGRALGGPLLLSGLA